MDINEKKIKKLEDLLDMLNDGLTKEEFEANFAKVIEIVKEIMAKNEKEFEAIRSSLENSSEEIKKETERLIKGIIDQANIHFEDLFKVANKKISQLNKSLIPGPPGTPGKDADTNKVLNDVLAKITIPTLEDMQNSLPALGEKFRDGLELLNGDERLDISAIKDLKEYLEKLEKIANDSEGARISGGLTRMKTDSLYVKFHEGGSNLTVSDTEPLNPELYDLWFDTA